MRHAPNSSTTRCTLTRRAFAALATVALAACAGAPPAPPPAPVDTGIRGQLTLAVPCTTTSAGAGCIAHPYQGRVAIEIAGGGRRVHETLTDEQGRFSIPLSPGNYRVIASPPEPAVQPRAAPRTVSVPDDGYATVNIALEQLVR